eukprot:g2625.t1
MLTWHKYEESTKSTSSESVSNAAVKIVIALTLLGPFFKDSRIVRRSAVRCLRLLHNPFAAILPFTPQLVQVLRADPTTSTKRPSALVKFLMEGVRGSSAFMVHLYMLLRAEEPGSLRQSHRVILRSIEDVGANVLSASALLSQSRSVWGCDGILSTLGRRLRTGIDTSGQSADEDETTKTNVHRQSLDYVVPNDGSTITHNRLHLKPIDSDAPAKFGLSDAMQPNTLWKASLSVMESECQSELRSGSTLKIMFKEGDDLRQDMVILQFLSVMNHFWSEAGLDLPMVIYRVQPTGYRMGIVEMVPHSMTWQEIMDNFGGDESAPIRFLHKHNPSARMFDAALDRFTRSLAAYFVATGITGLGDRHQDNIMMASNGLFFHIDFGLCLGRKTQQMGIIRERYHGSLLTTGLMAVVCARKGRGIGPKRYFVRLCCKALRVLQQPLAASTLQQMLILMRSSGADDLYRVEHVGLSQHFLRPHWPRHQTEAWIADLVEKNMGGAVNYWRNVEQGVRKALRGGKTSAALAAKRMAKPYLRKLAVNFGCSQTIPFSGCFRVGAMIPELSTVLASKAMPLSLCFEGLTSSRFVSYRNNRRKSSHRPHAIKFLLGESTLLRIHSPRLSRCKWKNWAYKTGAGSIISRMKKRWVVVQEGELLWYRNDKEEELRNKLSLKGYRVKVSKSDSRYGFGVELSGGVSKRSIKLYVESRARRRELVDVLREEIRRCTPLLPLESLHEDHPV